MSTLLFTQKKQVFEIVSNELESDGLAYKF